jgi:hypothetical protein
MDMFQAKVVEKIKTGIFYVEFFFLEIRAVYGIL